MVLQLNPDLALSRLVPDEGVLEQLLCGWSAGIRLHKAGLNKVDKFLGPGRKGEFVRAKRFGSIASCLVHAQSTNAPII